MPAFQGNLFQQEYYFACHLVFLCKIRWSKWSLVKDVCQGHPGTFSVAHSPGDRKQTNCILLLSLTDLGLFVVANLGKNALVNLGTLILKDSFTNIQRQQIKSLQRPEHPPPRGGLYFVDATHRPSVSVSLL